MEIFPEFAEGPEGIDGYSHVFVLVYFGPVDTRTDRSFASQTARAFAKRFQTGGAPFAGSFRLGLSHTSKSHRAHTRACCQTGANRLFVKGLDFFDGTPILDIKDYRPQYRTDDHTLPDWFRKLADEKGYV